MRLGGKKSERRQREEKGNPPRLREIVGDGDDSRLRRKKKHIKRNRKKNSKGQITEKKNKGERTKRENKWNCLGGAYVLNIYVPIDSYACVYVIMYKPCL